MEMGHSSLSIDQADLSDQHQITSPVNNWKLFA
jgi:hypothetical protein